MGSAFCCSAGGKSDQISLSGVRRHNGGVGDVMGGKKPIHVCSCGRVCQTKEDWEKLPYWATCYQTGIIMEYRNCSCRSTLAIELGTCKPVAGKVFR